MATAGTARGVGHIQVEEPGTITLQAERFERQRQLPRREAAALAAEEYRRMEAALRSIGAGEWELPTDCTGWTVRDLVAHLSSTVRDVARPPALIARYLQAGVLAVRQQRDQVDVLNDLNLQPRRAWPGPMLVDEFALWWPRAARMRMVFPPPLRWSPLFLLGQVRYLSDIVDHLMTRDVWIHRVDLCRALGRPMQLDAAHDGRVIRGVALEWAHSHGQPATLVLEGPAGGAWVQGPRAQRELYRLDAVEFARIVSGRAPGDGLLQQRVAF